MRLQKTVVTGLLAGLAMGFVISLNARLLI